MNLLFWKFYKFPVARSMNFSLIYRKKCEQDNLVMSLSELNSQILFCIFEEISKRSEIRENW